jgi:hypothetical protein
MNRSRWIVIIIITAALLVFIFSACNLPLFKSPGQTSFDQAHLMMITSRSLLDLYVPLEVTASEANTSPTMASLYFDPRLLSTLEELNQQKALALEYQRLAGAASNNGNMALAGIWTQKAQAHFAAAERLEAKRAEWRRSHRVLPAIQRGIHGFGNAIGQVLDFAMRNLADNIKSRFDAYVNEIKAFLRNPIRYSFDLALNRQLEIIKNQFLDRLGPFFGERAYNLIRLDQRAWKFEGRLFNTRTPRTTKTPKTPPPTKQVETPVNPTETQGTIPPNVVGAWHGDMCDEAEGTFIYRWSLDLMKEPAIGQVVGTLKFHDCPGGGRVLFRVVGVEQAGSVITLTGTLKGGGGELLQTVQGEVTPSSGDTGTMSFTFDSSTGEIEPNFSP